jgi:glyoxylase-like metal-dependent hydrolase (beta-lactamase superfamily II)
VTSYKLRENVSVLEGSGGNIAVLTGPDGKVLVDGGISVSRPQLTKTLSSLGPEPITHLINTHWHFDHTSGNEWLHSVGAKIIAHDNTRKHLSEIQRVEDWDYNFPPLPSGAVPTEVLSTNRKLTLNGASLELKRTTQPIPIAIFQSLSRRLIFSIRATPIGTASIPSLTIQPAAASTG